MWTNKFYGIISIAKDEKKIMAGVNEYLATVLRTTSRAKNKPMLEKKLPFVYKHFYWNLNKEYGTWFEIFPNADVEGKQFYTEHANCAWILKMLFHDDTPNYNYERAQNYIDSVIKSTGKEFILIKEGRQ